MSDHAVHLFLLGVALLAVPLTAMLGPGLTWAIGGLCLFAAVVLGFSSPGDGDTASDDAPAEHVNCDSCGARVPVLDGACEHCGASL